MSEPLNIPGDALGKAYDALYDARRRGLELAQASAVVLTEAAPLVAAAELRRLADDWERGMDDYIADGADNTKRAQCVERKARAAVLRGRADELDPDGAR